MSGTTTNVQLAGYPDGYPVLFAAHLTKKRALQLLTYLQDGGLLSPRLTKTVTLTVCQVGTKGLLMLSCQGLPTTIVTPPLGCIHECVGINNGQGYVVGTSYGHQAKPYYVHISPSA